MRYKRTIFLNIFLTVLLFVVYLQVQLPVHEIKNLILKIPDDLTYKKIIEKEISLKPKLNLDKDKFLIFSCDKCGGWADRLKGLLSSYALALLLNRTFIIDIHQPCRISKLIDPNMVDWDQPFPDNISDANTYYLGIGYSYGDILKFEKGNILNLTERKYIDMNAAVMFANAFPKNSFLEERIRQLGYTPSQFTIFDQIYRWYHELFRMPARLIPKYEEFLRQAKLNKDSKLICAQVRI